MQAGECMKYIQALLLTGTKQECRSYVNEKCWMVSFQKAGEVVLFPEVSHYTNDFCPQTLQYFLGKGHILMLQSWHHLNDGTFKISY